MRRLTRVAFLCLIALNAAGSLQAAGSVQPQESELPAPYFTEMAELKFRYKLYADALALYTAALSKKPDLQEQARCQMGIAFTLEAQGNNDAALNTWKSLTSFEDPLIACRARLILGQRYADSGDVDSAVALLEEVALREKATALRLAAASKLADVILSSHRATEKIQGYQAALAANPRDAVLLHLVLGLQRNDPLGRAATCEAVSKAAPLDDSQMDMWGSALIEAGKLTEATQFYQQWTKNNPNQTGLAYERLATIAARNGKLDEAEALIAQCCTVDPGDTRGELELCRKLLTAGVLAGAEKHGRAAYTAAGEPTMKGAAAMELGEALFRQGKFDEARALLSPLAEQNQWQGLKQRAQLLVTRFPRLTDKSDNRF